jgi:hypothetical protein
MPLEGVTYLSNERHATLPNACVDCHVDDSGEGIPPHTFAPTYDGCGGAAECHSGTVDAGVEATADYDGDGTVEAFQEEIQGLLDIVDAAIVEKLAGGSYVAEGGAIVFSDQAGQAVTPPNEVYAATYNKILIDYDSSLGVHNPAFAVSLLQATYESLTGSPAPGAPIDESN